MSRRETKLTPTDWNAHRGEAVETSTPWLSGDKVERQADYWRETLAGVPALLELPTDRRRPAEQDFAGRWLPFELDASLTADLKRLGQRHGMTLLMVVLAGWFLVLSRLTGQKDLVVGTPVANRRRTELENPMGVFINSVALRVRLPDEATVRDLMECTKAATLGAQENQDLPFEKVVELAQVTRTLAYSPLFQVMFTWYGEDEQDSRFEEISLAAVEPRLSTSTFDISLNLTETGYSVSGGFEYAASLFDVDSMKRHAGYFRRVLQEMVRDTSRQVSRLDLLSEQERQQIVVEWNQTQSGHPRDQCIHELFEDQVERNPEAVAVVYEQHSLDYRELNARANRLARHLRALGVGPDQRVVICLERSLEMVVGLLAILKAGGAYVPLDPAYPVERLRYMLTDSAPVVVLSAGSARSVLEQALQVSGAPPLVDVTADASQWAQHCAENLGSLGLASHHLAYVIYTSGSTGQPKGAVIRREGFKNLLTWYRDEFGFNESDRLLVATSFSFDLTQKNILVPLLVGAQLHLNVADAFDPRTVLSALVRRGITSMNLVPSMLQLLLQSAPSTAVLSQLRLLILGGEAIPPSLLTGAMKQYPRAVIANGYGPTEGGGICAFYRISMRDVNPERSIPIGRPISNMRIYILDEHGAPVPVGVVGEIYIGGVGVASGYLNRPELTAERFVRDPFNAAPRARIYRTGDLGRYLPDGNIEFLGRNDFQVKIRGFRIELGEIEARLLEHPRIREAAVLAREDVPGDKRLVAYYSLVGGGQISVESLKEHLSRVLTSYMVPAAYVRLPTLPLTPNGKLDRKALPAPDQGAYGARHYEPPQGAAEIALARIWSEVLRIGQVGRHDNFFELGGHSLLAGRVLERMRREGLKADVRALFISPTLSELALRTHEIRELVL